MRLNLKARIRAFAIWQKLGYNPWSKPKATQKKGGSDFYRGAFDSIPFLNDDAKRTFRHLLLRPGYMIRDYINGDHERYLAPLTALIVFYAFFALVCSVLQPIQNEHEKDSIFEHSITINTKNKEDQEKGEHIARNTMQLLKQGYAYLTLDRHPENVKTRGEAALAALEGTLRSQGIPLFIGQFFLLWFALSFAIRRHKKGMAATAAASAFILCQFSFFMLFALLLTWGESKSVSALVMLVLIAIDLHQWLETSWRKSIRLAIWTSILYGIIFVLCLLCISIAVVVAAWLKTSA